MKRRLKARKAQSSAKWQLPCLASIPHTSCSPQHCPLSACLSHFLAATGVQRVPVSLPSLSLFINNSTCQKSVVGEAVLLCCSSVGCVDCKPFLQSVTAMRPFQDAIYSCVPVCVPLWLWSFDKSLGDIELTAVLGATTGRARERVDRVLFSTVPSHFTCWQGALAQMALRAAVGLAACLPGWQLTMAKVSSVLKQAQLLKHSLAFFPSLPFPLPPPMFD